MREDEQLTGEILTVIKALKAVEIARQGADSVQVLPVHCGFENIFEEPYMMAYFWSLAGLLMWAGFLQEDKQEVRA